MTSYQSEELENIRRQARKIKRSMERYFGDEAKWASTLTSGVLDSSILILDMVERIKNDNKKAQDSTAGH